MCIRSVIEGGGGEAYRVKNGIVFNRTKGSRGKEFTCFFNRKTQIKLSFYPA